jgi:hypothetical protein
MEHFFGRFQTGQVGQNVMTQRRELQMTTDELEHELAELQARLQRVEREHGSLLNSYAKLAASREQLRSETDESMRLFSQYWDDRLGSVAMRCATDGGSDQPLAEAIGEFARDLSGIIRHALDEQEVRIMDRVAHLFEVTSTNHGRVIDALSRHLDQHVSVER